MIKAKPKVRVRPESRAAAAVKALLDSGDLLPVPGCYLEYHGGEGAHIHPAGVMQWARSLGMEQRDHDIVEVERCIQEISDGGWTRYAAPLSRARGLWVEATGYAHDFDGDGRCSWQGSFDPRDAAREVKEDRDAVEKARKEAEWKARIAGEYAERAAASGSQFNLAQAARRRAEADRAAEVLATSEHNLAVAEEIERDAWEARKKKSQLME